MRYQTVLVVSLLAVSVQAQPSRTLTVEEAILKARDRAPERLRAEALVRQSAALRQHASAFFTERAELEVEYISEQPFGERDYELSIGLLQELPIWGSQGRRRELADAVERASNTTQDALDNAIALRTRLLFNRAWSLSRQIELGNRMIVASERLVAATNKRLDAGDISRLERNTIVLETNSIRIEHERVHSEYDQAIGELEALIGDELEGVALQADTLSLPFLPSEDRTLYTLSPAWIQIENEIVIARAQLELARAEVLGNPTIGLHYSQDLLTIDGDQVGYHEGASRTIEGITAPGKAAGVSFSMQIPISLPGIWGPDGLEVIEIEAELRDLEADKAVLQLELAGRIARLQPRLGRITRALAIYRESEQLVAENDALLERGYEGGELSVTELLVGRQQLMELQTVQLELIQEMRDAEIELQSILGR